MKLELLKRTQHIAVMITAVVSCTVILSACSSPQPKATVASKPINTKVVTTKRSGKQSNHTGLQLASIAESQLGSPYKYGGSSPKGFDCSGLVYYTHNKLGIAVPRTTGQQAQRASSLSLASIEPGDILFFKIYGNKISHVGIYTGNNQFIHAPKSGKYVSHASIHDPFWSERLVKAGRLH